MSRWQKLPSIHRVSLCGPGRPAIWDPLPQPPVCLAIYYFPFRLLPVARLSNFKYLWGKGRDSFELRRSWQVWWCSKDCVYTRTFPLHNILLCYELGLDTFRFHLTVRSHEPLSHLPFLSESNYLHVAECRGEKFSWNLNKMWKKGHMFVKLSKHPHFLFSFCFIFRVWTFD